MTSDEQRGEGTERRRTRGVTVAERPPGLPVAGLPVLGPAIAKRSAGREPPSLDPNRPIGRFGMIGATDRCANHHCKAPVLPQGYLIFALEREHRPYRAGLCLCIPCASDLHPDTKMRAEAFVASIAKNALGGEKAVQRIAKGVPDNRGARR